MDKSNKISIAKETRAKLVAEVKGWFLDHREEEIGDLQAELLIDFMIEHIGAEIYNQALNDAMIWLKARLSDVEIDYYSLEKKASNE